MRGEFFIDGDKIFLFPQKCVVSWGQSASNVPPELVTHGPGIPRQPNLPIPSLTISESSNIPSASTFSGPNTIKHPSQSISLMSLNNSAVSSQLTNKFSLALIMHGTKLVRHPIHPVSTMTFNNSSNIPSPLIIPSTKITRQPLINPALTLLKEKCQLASNFPSALIMTGAELKRQLILPMPTMTLSQSPCSFQSTEMSQAELKKQLIYSNAMKLTHNFPSAVIMSGAQLKKKLIHSKPAMTLSQVLFNDISKKSCQGANNGKIKNPEPFVEGPIQSTSSIILSQSLSNVDNPVYSNDNVSMQDPTDFMEATTEMDANLEVSSPIYINSQKGGKIMYYSSFLYTARSKKPGKIYYSCRNSSCQAIASEVNGHVVVKRQHNHDPPREEYEALVTKERLKKAVAANPTQKLISVYNQTLSSRLSEVPDLGNYPKATPRFKSVRYTLKRVTMAKQPRLSCKSKVNIGSQDCSNDHVAQPIPTTTLSQSCNVPLLISSGVNIARPVQSSPSMTLSKSAGNVQNSLDGFSMQDATVLKEASNEMDANVQVSSPLYLKSQKGKYIMYYSSYLYLTKNKSGDKTFYGCRNSSCQASASEINGRVVVKRQHNHDPPREEYEALIIKEKLKTAVVANPNETLRSVYHQTLTSRLSEVPDLGDYPKATPLFESVRSTLKRAIKAKQPGPLSESEDQIGCQSPQDQTIDPLSKRNKSLS